MTAAVKSNSRQRDEFLRALEEARRAAAEAEEDARPAPTQPAGTAHASIEIRQAIDRMAGRIRTYISAGLLSRLYGENLSRTQHRDAPPDPPPPMSEHDQVVAELHLTPNLTPADLKLIRRRFAKRHHPDRVTPEVRDQATRRMTIANSLIDEALRGIKTRAQ
jgi:hypothetical protein